jgi:aminoglycoside phosphotransferase (APT) family kinase protein
VRALQALTPGARGRLPFAVPEVRGVGEHPLTVVTRYLPGSRLRLAHVRAGSDLAVSLGAAVAAVHALPTAVVSEAGLPVLGPGDAQRIARDLVERAAATGRVPGELLARWRDAAGDAALWRFQPVVVHGALDADALLTAERGAPDERLVGVLGWSGLEVGDPARDLAWALALPGAGAAADVLAAYAAARHGTADRELSRRAMLHGELELARWLLHGVESGSTAVTDDAVRMLEGLSARVRADAAGSLGHEAPPVLSVAEVEQMLEDQRQTVLERTGPLVLPAAAAQRSRSSSAE